MGKELEEKYAGMSVVKSAKRREFVDAIVKALTAKHIYNYSFNSEESFVHHIGPELMQGLVKAYQAENPDKAHEWVLEKAQGSLIEEKNKKVTVNHTQFFGTQHRPDMFIKHGDDYRIAVEFKLVDAGSSIREALGQGLVYASEYEFSILVLLDTTKDQKVKHAYQKGVLENKLVEKLWNDFGIRVVVVGPSK